MGKKYILEATVFCSGAIVMIFEIVGSRIYGPYFGTSTFVWTTLIGVILGCLSAGYYVGGIYADKNPTLEKLANIFLGASICMLGVFFLKDALLGSFQNMSFSLELKTIVSACILFFPVSFLLGLVSPYAVKLNLQNFDSSGQTVGRMYALGTFGSIIGTFAAGLYLIPLIGTNKLLFLLAIALMIVSLSISIGKCRVLKLVYFFLLCLGFGVFHQYNEIAKAEGLIDVDTKYSRIMVYDFLHRSGKEARKMQINTENHSSMFLESDELTNEYTKYYHLAQVLFPEFQHGLMIGGAGYSFPKSYLQEYPDKTLDVVEIDEGVTELARKYFRLTDSPRMNIYHEDARSYLNTTDTKYDVIFGDAFTSFYSVPYQLTTLEAVQKKYDILTEKGVVILNIISSIEGEKGKFFRAEYATYKEVFPHVYVIPVDNMYNGKGIRNLMLVALKDNEAFENAAPVGELRSYMGNIWRKEIPLDMPILTDDYAPVNAYLADAF